jgi:hypothetical protein
MLSSSLSSPKPNTVHAFLTHIFCKGRHGVLRVRDGSPEYRCCCRVLTTLLGLEEA